MIESNTSDSSSEFEKWVEGYFADSDDGPADEGQDDWISNQELAEHYARLFENPAFLTRKYTREQLAVGLWNVFGFDGRWSDVMSSSVSESTRHRCIRAIGSFYTDFLDPLCESVPVKEPDTDSFRSAVFMIWDMDGLCGIQQSPEFRDDCVGILWAAIHCQSPACITSGLHGIGHWIALSEHHRESELVSWLRACVDDFLARYRQTNTASPAVIEYALNARTGCVM